MSFLKNNSVFIFLISINMLFVVYLAKLSYKIDNFNYIFVTLLILGGILFYWFLHNIFKKTAWRVAFILLLLSAAAAFYLFNLNYVNSMLKIYLIDNFSLINSLVSQNKPTNFDNFKPIFVVVLPALAFIIILFTDKGAVNTILTVNLALIVTLWYLGYTEEIKKYLFHYVFITLVTYCINIFIKNLRKLSKRGIRVGIKSTSIIIYTILISFVIAGISNLLPQSFRGRYGSELQGRFYNKFGNSVENGEQKGKKYKYDISYSGYGNSSGKLGGPTYLNKLVAFRVNSDKPYYLRGNIKDSYDGFSWQQSEKKYTQGTTEENSLLKDTFSRTYFNDSKEIVIHPEELNSSTIFTPNLSYSVNIEKNFVYSDEESTFISSGIIEKPYTVFFYSLNDRGNGVINANGTQNTKEVGAAFYAEYYKKYLQVPDNISSRVYDLVYSLTKNKKTNFQKVEAIREYLNKNYPYTLKVSQVPEGQEFLDYFLFTEKKGYCTYFATAETIMCRIAGIPARYVEGFNMTEEKDGNELYVVRNENAHAWTEVLYMEGPIIGLWYTVDAVPNAVQAVHKEEEQAKTEVEKTPGEISEPNVIPPKKPSAGGGNEGAEGTTTKLVIPPKVLKVLYVILAVLLINGLVILVFVRKKAIMLRSRSIIPLYKYSLDRLFTIGYNSSEFVADMEFINNMKEGLSEKVKEAANLAYKEYYGGKAPVEFNKQEYYRFIENEVRKRQGLLEYFIKKYYFFKKISLIKQKVVLLYKKIRRYN